MENPIDFLIWAIQGCEPQAYGKVLFCCRTRESIIVRQFIFSYMKEGLRKRLVAGVIYPRKKKRKRDKIDSWFRKSFGKTRICPLLNLLLLKKEDTNY